MNCSVDMTYYHLPWAVQLLGNKPSMQSQPLFCNSGRLCSSTRRMYAIAAKHRLDPAPPEPLGIGPNPFCQHLMSAPCRQIILATWRRLGPRMSAMAERRRGRGRGRGCGRERRTPDKTLAIFVNSPAVDSPGQPYRSGQCWPVPTPARPRPSNPGPTTQAMPRPRAKHK